MSHRVRASLILTVALAGACSSEDPPDTPPGRRQRTEKNAFGLITCSGKTADTTCVTHRMIAGVSMGSSGAGQIGFQFPELFDAVGMLGISLVDWVYMLRLIEHYHMGGFCERETILANLATVNTSTTPGFCGPVRGVEKLEPSGRIMEADQDFNHWYRWIDEGRGGTFGRNKLRESLQDLSLAFGNPFSYNPESPYWPPGVPMDYRSMSDEEACQTPTVIKGLRHKEYNPTGEYDVIPFCDTDTNGGDFDPRRPAEVPSEILLSVDYNSNGRRDYAEPILNFSNERFEDVGEGPSDVYDWQTNPKGKAMNWRYDEGEPYEDLGLDGVEGTGDFGEGNGRFDYNPNIGNIFAQNPRTMIEEMPEEQLARLHIYADAGIRDFLMSAAGTNWFWGGLRSRVGAEAKDYADFLSLTPEEDEYDFLKVDFTHPTIGRHVYVRYGNPDAVPRDVNRGDGHHVGPPDQVLSRFLTSIGFLQSRIVDGDRKEVNDAGDVNELIEPKVFYSTSLGRDWKYGIVFPPGYYAKGHENDRYPVLYMLHGQGMESESLLASGILFFAYQAGSAVPARQRRHESDWAKFILVFPDAKCPEGDGDPEECSSGNFNTNHPGFDGNGPRYTDELIELMAHIEASYRVRAPEEIPL
ncbi:MAG: hypothetical protein HYV07_25410 [Deltaproteobacteria bacterium]|nr:hypothetical protein [Deltaproteobacteria bacterium]